MEKKAFKETAIGKFLLTKAPNILKAAADVADDYFPPAKIITAMFDKEKPDMTPEQKLEFERLLKEYEEKELAAYLADVKDARDLQKVALQQEDKFSKRFLYYLTTGSLILGFAYIFFITFGHIPVANQRFADTILGVVISVIFGTVYSFFFGSSKGSKEKTEMLVKKTEK